MAVKAEPKTSPETYYVGAYWGAREEPPEACARRTADLLRLLAPCDPFLAHWYKPTRSLKDARKFPLMPPDLAMLTEQFRQGVNRERGGPIFEELGFHVAFGNGGGDYDSADLRILCGGSAEAVSNACVLSLPTLGYSPNAERIITASVLTQALRSMVLAWEPDWGVVMSHAHRDLDPSGRGNEGLRIGWANYFARNRGPVPPLPAPVRIEPIEDKGTLILLTPERFTAANREHLELAGRVHDLLARAGLLEPNAS